MNYTRLGLLGVCLALLFWLATLILRGYFFGQPISLPATALEIAILLSGALLFWWWIARRLRQSDAALRTYARRLAILHQAGLTITTEHDLAVVLQSVVEQSRILIGARYGALAVVAGETSSIQEFITAGLDAATAAKLQSHPPQGHGILGLPIREQRAIRVDDIAAHPASVGFPAHHPPMRSFLGVPIVSKGTVFGHLYLTDKVPTPSRAPAASSTAAPVAPIPFSEEDQQILKMFATQAAIAIENANLYRQSRELAVLRERERFGMDLHDGVIQSIYAVGLLLDDGLHRMDGELPTAKTRVHEAIQRLNTVIGDIRHYIHDLRAQTGSAGLHDNPLSELEQLAHTLRREAGLEVELAVDAEIFRQLTPRHNAEILQIVREASANVRRHAHATRLAINLHQTGNAAHLEIRDNGRGFKYPPPPSQRGEGLGNMQRRAKAIDATLTIHSAPQNGCRIQLRLPLNSPAT